MKIVYNKNLVGTETINEQTTIVVYNINVFSDIRIESDSYIIQSEEELLINISILISLYNYNIIDYNDLRKYLIINILPNWGEITDTEKAQLKSYFITPNDFVWSSELEEQRTYKLLVDNATLCRKGRIDLGRSYVSLLYKTETQKSQDFFIDTEAMMNRFIEGKIPELQAFINDSIIGIFDYTNNGFSTKSYYTELLKDKLNYILFR